jgi:hypothetical protein
MPTNDQIMGAVRTILAFLGGLAVAKGWVDAPTATALGGAFITLATLGWSLYSNSKTAMIQSVNATDNGGKVVADTVVAPQINSSLK